MPHKPSYKSILRHCCTKYYVWHWNLLKNMSESIIIIILCRTGMAMSWGHTKRHCESQALKRHDIAKGQWLLQASLLRYSKCIENVIAVFVVPPCSVLKRYSLLHITQSEHHIAIIFNCGGIEACNECCYVTIVWICVLDLIVMKNKFIVVTGEDSFWRGKLWCAPYTEEGGCLDLINHQVSPVG